jgi:hypothetical protein
MQSQVRNAEDHRLLLTEHPGLTRDDFALSPHVRGKHGEARLGDVVMYRNNAGEQLIGMLCLNYAAQLVQWSLVEAWDLKSVSGNLETWNIKSELIRIPTSFIIIALTFVDAKARVEDLCSALARFPSTLNSLKMC